MERGYIASVSRQIETWVVHGSVRKEDDRVGVYLFPRNAAEALGAQVAMLGTQRTAVRQQTERIPPPRHLERAWPHVFEGRETPNNWKPQELVVLTAPPTGVHKVCLRKDWENKLLPCIDSMLGRQELAAQRLKGDLPADRLGQHPLVRTLKAGSVVRMKDQTALVISNDVVHARHPYGFVIACPLLPSEKGRRSDEVALFVDGRRIAWELTQAITPLANATFEVVSSPDPSSLEGLSGARERFRRLLRGDTPVGVSWPRLEAYLGASSRQFAALRLSHQIAPLAEPQAKPWRPSPTSSSGGLPTTDRCHTPGTPRFGGNENIPIKTNSRRFMLWLQRHGDDVGLLVEHTCPDEDELLYAWVEGSSGVCLASGFAEDMDKSGVLALRLGKVVPERALEFAVMISTTAGTEAFIVQHRWVLGGSARR